MLSLLDSSDAFATDDEVVLVTRGATGAGGAPGTEELRRSVRESVRRLGEFLEGAAKRPEGAQAEGAGGETATRAALERAVSGSLRRLDAHNRGMRLAVTVVILQLRWRRRARRRAAERASAHAAGGAR